jgi:elongation factor P
MLDFSEIKLGKVVNFNNSPCVIVKCDFLRMQQRKPVKKCIMKNLITGANTEYSFKSGEGVEEADLEKKTATFLYQAEDNLSFMLSDSFETVDLPASLLEGKTGYLKNELEVNIQYFNGEPIAIDLPTKISFMVVSTPENVAKGNTVSGVMKDAELEGGAIIKVPNFVKNGEKIIVNTIEDEYVERDTNK